MKKQCKKKIAILLALILCITGLYHFDYANADGGGEATPSFTGISDTDDTTAMYLAKQIVGDNIEIESAKIIGNSHAFGIFDNAYDIVGFPKGIVLATGDLVENNIFSQGYEYLMEGGTKDGVDPITEEAAKAYGFYEEGDYPTVGEYVGRKSYYEPAILEFSIKPETDAVSFQYMVVSEEYPEYIDEFWDKFILCVNDKNYAKLPDKDETITIGNINHLHNAEYYRGLTLKDGISPDEAQASQGNIEEIKRCFDAANAISSTNFIFDGGTKVFSVDAPVNKGVTNTIRLAIADYSDELYDSAVFIKANSVKDKPAMYGAINIKYVDNENGAVYLERKGGYVGAVSVDLNLLGQDGSLLDQQTVEFKDGEYLREVFVNGPYMDELKFLQLTNPTGGVKINEEEKISYDNWIPIEALKELSGTVKGTVFEKNKENENVPAANAIVKIKSSDGSILETVTNQNGEYKIDGVKGGLHSILAENKDGSITKENSFYVGLDDINKKEKILDINLDQQIKIENSDSKNIIIDGLDIASAGNNVKVAVTPVESTSGSIADLVTDVKKKLNAEELYTLDIKLDMEKNGVYENQIELVSPISVTFPIPEGSYENGDFYVYHIHNNGSDTDVLYDKDNDPETFTAEIDKLSQFVLMHSKDTSDKMETTVIESIKNKVTESVKESVEAAKKQEEQNKTDVPTPTPDTTNTPTPGTPTPEAPTPTPDAPIVTPASPSPTPTVSPSPTPSAPNGNTSESTTPPSNNSSSSSSSSPSSPSPVGTPKPTETPLPDVNKDNDKEQAEKELDKVSVPAKRSLYVGQEKSVKPKNLPNGAKVTYKSNKKSVITIKTNGKAAVKKAGKAVITTTVTYKDISKVYKTNVTAKKPYIEIKAKKTTMKVGQSYQFKAKVYGSSKKITWSVSDKTKASINKTTGKLKANKSGKITVYAKSGKITKKITVKIKAK